MADGASESGLDASEHPGGRPWGPRVTAVCSWEACYDGQCRGCTQIPPEPLTLAVGRAPGSQGLLFSQLLAMTMTPRDPAARPPVHWAGRAWAFTALGGGPQRPAPASRWAYGGDTAHTLAPGPGGSPLPSRGS